MNTTDEYLECDVCDGDGFYEILECGKAASMCCGGCYVPRECEDCEGTGEIENENYIDHE